MSNTRMPAWFLLAPPIAGIAGFVAGSMGLGWVARAAGIPDVVAEGVRCAWGLILGTAGFGFGATTWTNTLAANWDRTNPNFRMPEPRREEWVQMGVETVIAKGHIRRDPFPQDSRGKLIFNYHDLRQVAKEYVRGVPLSHQGMVGKSQGKPLTRMQFESMQEWLVQRMRWAMWYNPNGKHGILLTEMGRRKMTMIAKQHAPIDLEATSLPQRSVHRV